MFVCVRVLAHSASRMLRKASTVAQAYRPERLDLAASTDKRGARWPAFVAGGSNGGAERKCLTPEGVSYKCHP
jgi:hypothetical protein